MRGKGRERWEERYRERAKDGMRWHEMRCHCFGTISINYLLDTRNDRMLKNHHHR